jgi:hypothetical protein
MLNAIIEMITINILSIYNFALKCNMVINELIEVCWNTFSIKTEKYEGETFLKK